MTEISSTSVLTGVRDALVAEIIATPVPRPVTIRRDIAVIIAAALGEVIADLDQIQRLVSRSEQPAAALKAAREAAADAAGCVVIDLGDVLSREARMSARTRDPRDPRDGSIA